MKYAIRSMQLTELPKIYRCIEEDFAPGEYAPYNILMEHLAAGVQKGWMLLAGEQEVAYAICAEGATNDYVLISLLAVYQEFRGRGFGTAMLAELKGLYSAEQGMIVEVEKPEEATIDQEKVTREKRIRFYQKAGFSLVPGIDYAIWDVPMHLMALPQQKALLFINQEIGKIMYEIYLGLMGERFIHKLKCVELGG